MADGEAADARRWNGLCGVEFRPGVGGAHVDDANCLDARTRRLNAEQARGLATLDAAPELLLRGQQEMLVEGIRRDADLDPLATPGDDGEHRQFGIGDPHVVLQLGRVLFGRPLFGERPWQHELGLENRPGGFDHAVEGCRHVADDGMLDPTLDVGEHLAGVALEPVAVEGFGDHTELNDEVAGKVLGRDFAALFPPEAEEGTFEQR